MWLFTSPPLKKTEAWKILTLGNPYPNPNPNQVMGSCPNPILNLNLNPLP